MSASSKSKIKVAPSKFKCPKCRVVVKNVDSICCDNCLNWFHVKCSKVSRPIFNKFLKDSTLTFVCDFCTKYPCGKCNLGVFPHNKAICCDLTKCNKWYHLKCTKVSLARYNKFCSKDNEDEWVCDSCMLLPFASLSNHELCSIMPIHDTPAVSISNISSTKCSICMRGVHQRKSHKVLVCHSCNHWVHRKCSSISLSTLNSLSRMEFKQWECSECQSDKFAFSQITSKDIVSMSFNSNFDCPCKVTCLTSFLSNRKLYSLDLFKKDENDKFYLQHDPLEEIDQGMKIDMHFDLYEEHDFHKLMSDRVLHDDKKLFSIFHTNIESIHNKIDNIHIALSNLGHTFDVIALSEIWVDKNDKRKELIGNLEGYQKFLFTPGNSLKGGCGFFVKNGLKVLERKDFDISFSDDTNEYETKWIELVNQNDKNILIGVCYRHPRKKSTDSFCQYLEKTLQKIAKKNTLTFIVGDFNYDLLKVDNDKFAATFLNTMMANSFQPCILEPTRLIAGNRPTLIDNIFFNSIEKEVYSGNLMNKLSDHLPQFILVKGIKHKPSKANRKQKDFSSFDENMYKEDIRNINLTIANDGSAESLYNEFHKQCIGVVDKHVPTVTLSAKDFSFKQKPWISPSIQRDIAEKNKLNAKFNRTKNSFWYELYKILNKKVRKSIFDSKKKYYKEFFEKNHKNLKKVWSGLNDLIAHKKRQNTEEIFLNDCDGITTDQNKVADSFNKYFTNVAKNLVRDLGDPNTKPQDYLKNPNKHSIFLKEVDQGEVRKILKTLDTKKSGDVYGLTPFLVKIACDELTPILTLLFNKSFSEGVFPSVLKYAKVVPIHKGDSKFIMSNYRPIALIPIIGKCMEKLMHSRLYDFLTKMNILYKRQYGFQKGKSTEQAIFDIHENVASSLEKGETPCCIFLDFAKAFDTVDREILIKKLSHYGIRGKALSWIDSYLTNRKQCVEINGVRSLDLPIETGVPQGSILGPLLFLIYVNDMHESSAILKFVMFADDTCLFFAHKDKKVIENVLAEELPKVCDWLKANKLSLNVKKSNYMVFRNKKDNSEPLLTISINGEPVEEVKCAKYLGIFIDHKLTFKEHINHVAKKLTRGNILISRLRHFVTREILTSFYHAHFHSHLNYGSIAWGTAAPSYIQNLTQLQEKSLYLLSFRKLDDNNKNSIFNDFQILPVRKHLFYCRCLFIWKVRQKLFTDIIISLFSGILPHPNHLVNCKYIVPYRKKCAAINSLTCQGIKQWNKISARVASLESFKLFKIALVDFLRKRPYMLKN